MNYKSIVYALRILCIMHKSKEKMNESNFHVVIWCRAQWRETFTGPDSTRPTSTPSLASSQSALVIADG